MLTLFRKSIKIYSAEILSAGKLISRGLKIENFSSFRCRNICHEERT